MEAAFSTSAGLLLQMAEIYGAKQKQKSLSLTAENKRKTKRRPKQITEDTSYIYIHSFHPTLLRLLLHLGQIETSRKFSSSFLPPPPPPRPPSPPSSHFRFVLLFHLMKSRHQQRPSYPMTLPISTLHITSLADRSPARLTSILEIDSEIFLRSEYDSLPLSGTGNVLVVHPPYSSPNALSLS